jgi:uncharacterized phage protein (TIGR01671 family)
MSRVIKFRGKTERGRWIYGYYSSRHCIWDESVEDDIEILPSTIGQFTGLKDKAGVEIYEGDVVGVCERGHEWVVEWGYFGDAGFYAHNQINSGRTLDASNYGDHAVVEITPDEVMDCLVSGNIHDNPELLNSGE